jgi:hypothetical protein
MTNSNLIPTPRVDKNGRLVTKHMKPQATPVAAAAIPAPALDLAMAPNMVTIPSNVQGLDDLWKAHRISKTPHTLDSFDPRAVEAVNDLIRQGDKLDRKFGLNIAITEAFTLMSEYGMPLGMHNLAVFGGCAMRHANTDVTAYICALHEMNAPKEIDYLLDATDEERHKAQTLIEFTIRAEEALGQSVIYYSSEDRDEVMEFTHLRDPELTNFILANPESADDVFDVLVAEGGPVPVDVIQERLQHSEKSLRGGVL